MNKNKFDAIIIGGSYAGLSAAMALGRSLKNTLIIDSGKPCNRQTPHSHNFLTQDGKTPKEISTIAKSQVAKYDSISFYDGIASQARRIANGFEVTTSNGEIFEGSKLVLATGIKDIFPEIPGLSECWGISVVHCPYCHGYEIREKNTAIIANGDRAVHLASLVKNLTKKITILSNGKADFEEAQQKKLNEHNIPVIEKEIATIEHSSGQLERIQFKDGSTEVFECAYASLPFEQNTSIANDLDCEFTDGGHIKVDFMQKTSQKGIYACGDNSSMMRSVATAVYTGNVTGAMINHELTQEKF